MKNHALSFSLSALLTVFATAPLALAQGQTLTFGVSPGQTTSGNGSLGVVVGGFGTVPINVPSGTSSQGIATAMAGALQTLGFTVQQNGTDVTVTSGPGGAPLQNGGGIGSTDSGITGIKAKVAPGAPPGNKQNGGNIPKANPAAQTNQNGSIQVDVEVLKLINGVWTLMWIQVVVPIVPGDTGATVNQRVKQQLEAGGLVVNEITLPPQVAPITTGPAYCLDRTQDGGKVQGIEMRSTGGGSQILQQRSVGAGQFPMFGSTEFGRGLTAGGQESDIWARWGGTGALGSNGVFEVFVDPGTFGAFTFGFGSSLDPWQPVIFPQPFVGPNFYTLLDLLSAPIVLGFPDPLGTMQMPFQIPPTPGLMGLELQMQALVIDPAAPNLPASLRSTAGVTLGIGQ